MKKKGLGIGLVALAGLVIVGSLALWVLPGQAEARYGGRQGMEGAAIPAEPAGSGPYAPDGAVGDLSESEVDALMMALDDEYKAWSVYDQVIADFDSVQPFASIQRAEEKHIAALVTLFDRYGLELPANDWPGDVPTFDTLADACAAGVQAEIDNASLYDQLFSMVDNPDIIRVFTALQTASETKHLPAFESCAP